MGTPFTAGSQPQRLTIDPSGQFAYVANAGSATVSAYSIDQVTGVLTPIKNPNTGLPTFPTGTMPQPVTVDPMGRFAYVTNLGDGTVSGYMITPASGVLTPMTGSPFSVGTNPEAITLVTSNEFSTGEFAYVDNAGSGNVSAFAADPVTGGLTPISGSPVGAGNAPQAIVVEPTGHFAFVPALGSNNVSVYRIDQMTGALTPVTGSPFPTGSAPQSATTAGVF
jgi:6-phosphogluconolactonase (cycloisomerase 2 family)